jgi:hypothetical protein
MMSLVRPPAHADFSSEARQRLDALRPIAAAGIKLTRAHFINPLWSVAKHKQALVGDASLTKCAWCETHCEWKRQLDVEHYRPKGEVARWIGSPPLVSDTPPELEPVSAGYWWLAYDWGNYSLACSPCNQAWKRTTFPVRGPRAHYGEGMEAIEVALLVDPMSPFRTADHFSWTELGYMNAESDRGEATIIACGLNRKQLVALRSTTARNVGQELMRLTRGLRTGTAEPHRRALLGLCALDAQFAGMNRWWVEYVTGRPWDKLVEATT